MRYVVKGCTLLFNGTAYPEGSEVEVSDRDLAGMGDIGTEHLYLVAKPEPKPEVPSAPESAPVVVVAHRPSRKGK